jgi:hypothetical protein
MDRSYPVRTLCAARMPGVHVSPSELSSRSASLLDREIQLYCAKRDGGIFSTVIFGGPATMKVEQLPHPRCAGPDARDDAVLIS